MRLIAIRLDRQIKIKYPFSYNWARVLKSGVIKTNTQQNSTPRDALNKWCPETVRAPQFLKCPRSDSGNFFKYAPNRILASVLESDPVDF